MDLIYQDQRIVSDRTIDSHIKKLRKKIAELIPEKEVICSVYGAGYRYVPSTTREIPGDRIPCCVRGRRGE